MRTSTLSIGQTPSLVRRRQPCHLGDKSTSRFTDMYVFLMDDLFWPSCRNSNLSAPFFSQLGLCPDQLYRPYASNSCRRFEICRVMHFPIKYNACLNSSSPSSLWYQGHRLVHMMYKQVADVSSRGRRYPAQPIDRGLQWDHLVLNVLSEHSIN